MMSASRLPALLGLSRYQTPNDELQYSINASKGLPREDKQNEAMAWGDRIERLILQETAKRLELLELSTEFDSAFFHKTLPLACSLDGWAHGRGQKIRTDMDAGIIVVGQDEIMLDGYGVLEAKLTAVSPEEMPALYRGPVQLQAQMDIMQARWGAVAVLYQGTVLRIFLFEPHKQTLETIKTAVLEFQNKIEKYKATGEIDYYPPANSKDADRMYPAADEAAVIKYVLNLVWKVVKGLYKGIFGVIKEVIKAITWVITSIYNAIKSIVLNIWKVILWVLNKVWQLAKFIWAWLVEAFVETLNQLWTLLGMFAAWLVLEGSAKTIVGYAIITVLFVWLITIRIREGEE